MRGQYIDDPGRQGDRRPRPRDARGRRAADRLRARPGRRHRGPLVRRRRAAWSSATTTSCGARRSPPGCAGAFPGVYADITADAVASQLRALGIEVKRVRERGQPKPLTGCERAAVAAAVERGDA